MLITIEGIDGAGKSVQAKLLYEALLKQCKSVLLTKEPGGSQFGNKIRNLLMEEDLDETEKLFLFLADRAFHMRNVVLPYDQAGVIVITDRFHDSTVAYQDILHDRIDDITRDDLRSLACREWEPDLTVYLELPVQTAIERCQSRGNNNKLDVLDAEYLIKVQDRYENSFGRGYCPVLRIDAQPSINEVHENIMKEIMPYINGVKK